MGRFTSFRCEESRIAVKVGDHQRSALSIFGYIGIDGHPPLKAQAAGDGFQNQEPG
jgi:hypothetical protein